MSATPAPFSEAMTMPLHDEHTMRQMPWESLIAAFVCLILLVAAWEWQQAVVRRRDTHFPTESPQQVLERFPMPEEFSSRSDLPADLFEVVARANPFSASRRPAPTQRHSASGDPGATEPAVVQFVYKGRIMMGGMPRAIIEESATKKTHFLQRGQAVAGLTLLEMTEDQMILSDPQTHESLVVPLTAKTVPVPSPSRKKPGAVRSEARQ